MPEPFYDILLERGLVAQCTEQEAAFRARLARPLTAYIGFDPTADSFHVGSLVPIMGLYWLQRCGHRPLVVVGGATALVGDPSGKSEMRRKMLSREEIAENCAGLKAELGRLLRFDDSSTGAVMLNNADWLSNLTWIDLLREVGHCFSVNRMLTMDSVKGRMETGGITFLEFNYMVMQAYDYLHLHRTYGCTLQAGGADQWGNIVMGIELARRTMSSELAGLTLPLVVKSDGVKFGKSEKGNIWLSSERTPVYEFYQFWRNAADGDVRRFLGYFTTIPMSEVDGLLQGGPDSPTSLNQAKERLAFEVTSLVHGKDAAVQAQEDARKAFGELDPRGSSIPHGDLPRASLEQGAGVVALLVAAGLATTTSEARRLIEAKGVRIHERVVEAVDAKVLASDTVDGYVLLRAGKKRLYRFDVR